MQKVPGSRVFLHCTPSASYAAYSVPMSFWSAAWTIMDHHSAHSFQTLSWFASENRLNKHDRITDPHQSAKG